MSSLRLALKQSLSEVAGSPEGNTMESRGTIAPRSRGNSTLSIRSRGSVDGASDSDGFDSPTEDTAGIFDAEKQIFRRRRRANSGFEKSIPVEIKSKIVQKHIENPELSQRALADWANKEFQLIPGIGLIQPHICNILKDHLKSSLGDISQIADNDNDNDNVQGVNKDSGSLAVAASNALDTSSTASEVAVFALKSESLLSISKLAEGIDADRDIGIQLNSPVEASKIKYEANVALSQPDTPQLQPLSSSDAIISTASSGLESNTIEQSIKPSYGDISLNSEIVEDMDLHNSKPAIDNDNVNDVYLKEEVVLNEESAQTDLGYKNTNTLMTIVDVSEKQNSSNKSDINNGINNDIDENDKIKYINEKDLGGHSETQESGDDYDDDNDALDRHRSYDSSEAYGMGEKERPLDKLTIYQKVVLINKKIDTPSMSQRQLGVWAGKEFNLSGPLSQAYISKLMKHSSRILTQKESFESGLRGASTVVRPISISSTSDMTTPSDSPGQISEKTLTTSSSTSSSLSSKATMPSSSQKIGSSKSRLECDTIGAILNSGRPDESRGTKSKELGAERDAAKIHPKGSTGTSSKAEASSRTFDKTISGSESVGVKVKTDSKSSSKSTESSKSSTINSKSNDYINHINKWKQCVESGEMFETALSPVLRYIDDRAEANMKKKAASRGDRSENYSKNNMNGSIGGKSSTIGTSSGEGDTSKSITAINKAERTEKVQVWKDDSDSVYKYYAKKRLFPHLLSNSLSENDGSRKDERGADSNGSTSGNISAEKKARNI